jgi:NAD(P)H-flavin reductase
MSLMSACVERHLTVTSDARWLYGKGVVTTLFPRHIEPDRTTAFMCGPEIMMHFAGLGLRELGVPAERIWLSTERHMECGIGLCGHCQLGPYFVCKDGRSSATTRSPR